MKTTQDLVQILSVTNVKSKTYKNLTQDEYMDMVHLYGEENVKNDLVVELMVLYPQQDILDAEGRVVTITEKDLHDIAAACNSELGQKLGHGLHRAKSWVKGHNEENYDYITLTEDHDLDIAKRMGFSNGKLEVRDHEGTPYLYARGHVLKPAAKVAIKQGLYREISATVRMDNTLKEISFVSAPALKYAGVFSEGKIDFAENARLIKEQEQVQSELHAIGEKLKLKEKEKNITHKLDDLLKCGKIFPRDVEFYRDTMMKLDDDSVNKTTTLLTLAEPVINLYRVDTRNTNFFKGVVMSKDFSRLVEDLEKGSASLEQLASNPEFKGKFAEHNAGSVTDKTEGDKVTAGEPNDGGAMPSNDTMMNEVMKFKAKFKAKFDEGDMEACKKMLAEGTDKVADDPAKTDGDLPDNAKLSEEVKELKGKYSELAAKNEKLVKRISKNNSLLQDLITKVTGKGE